ncbi:MscL family protein [Nocardioides sp.]|uniref:large conductance mechanosensitive channel protein MscL n=1 Tax=Nocardioides sp. TaxID=35761 RepID=UPI003527C0B8
MSGFKNFVLRGNLVDLAVAVIIATSFGAVVTTFTNWLTAQMPESARHVFSNKENTFGAFLNAVIAFLILAAVVYFFVVVPYTKARERFFPEEASGPTEVQLLTEIRDSLATKA